MTLLSRIADDVSVTERYLRGQIVASQKRVKLYRVRKRSGSGYRRIAVPPRPLKLVQYWVIENIARHIRIHDAATAFYPGCSIRANAERHRAGVYFVRLDLADFFPSISAEDCFSSIKPSDGELAAMLAADRDDPDLRMSLFCKDSCSIGFPISPYFANIVMRDIDALIFDRLASQEEELGAATYTRYADDITISIAKKGHAPKIIGMVNEVLVEAATPTLTLNRDKTKLGSTRGGGAFVTGLRVCAGGRLTLHRRYKDHVRLLLSLAAKGALPDNERASLVGHLSYCAHSDPRFYTKLATKYVDAFRDLVYPCR